MQPVWIKAFVLAARFADEDPSLADGLDPDACEAARREWQALSGADPTATAAKLVHARLALLRPVQGRANADTVAKGAEVLARWLQSLPTGLRPTAVRGMNTETASAVLARVSRAKPLTPEASREVERVLSVALGCLGRAMSAAEWGEWIDGAVGVAPLASDAVVRVDRALRMRGVRASAIVRALAVEEGAA